MIPVVELDDVIEAIAFQTDCGSSYLNQATGKVIYVSDEDFHAIEMKQPIEKFPEWQQEEIRVVQDMLAMDNYLTLPSKFDVHEYAIMEQFCLSIADNRLKNIMYQSIKGGGAFGRFETNIRRYHILEDWDKFRMDTMREMAINWCNDHHIRYKENHTEHK